MSNNIQTLTTDVIIGSTGKISWVRHGLMPILLKKIEENPQLLNNGFLNVYTDPNQNTKK
jgi:hypothetical protein